MKPPGEVLFEGWNVDCNPGTVRREGCTPARLLYAETSQDSGICSVRVYQRHHMFPREKQLSPIGRPRQFCELLDELVVSIKQPGNTRILKIADIYGEFFRCPNSNPSDSASVRRPGWETQRSA